MIKSSSIVYIHNFMDEMRSFSWESADILLCMKAPAEVIKILNNEILRENHF